MSSPAGAPVAPPRANPNAYRGNTFRVVITVMTVITLVAMILRFVSRRLMTNKLRFWWDDWVALAAVPFIMAQMTVCFVMLNYGLGHHVEVVEPKDLAVFFRLLWSIYFVYDTALAITKASALLFLSRVFPRRANSAFFNFCLYATHGLNISWLIAIILSTIFMCNPIEKNWNPMHAGKCGPTNALWIGSAIPSVLIDLIILILPLPKIWGLRMSPARKGGITVVFLLGYLVIVVSLGRLITVLTSSKGLSTDITYEIIPMSLWVAAEAPVTILCICLPAMLPLGRHLVSAYFSPLAIRISSSWNSRGDGNNFLRSKNGSFASAPSEPSTPGWKLRLAKLSSHSMDGDESVHSAGHYSLRGVVVSHPKEHDSTRVQAGGPVRAFQGADMPKQAIRVDKAFMVDRRG